MVERRVLWIGDNRQPEFARICESIGRQAELRFVPTLDEQLRIDSELVVFAQPRPGQLSGQAATELAGRWTNSQFLWLLGEWCSGLKRTGGDFGEIPVAYAHEVPHPATLARLYTLAGGESDIQAGLSAPAASAIAAEAIREDHFVAIYAQSKSYRTSLREAISPTDAKSVELGFGDGVASMGVNVVLWEAAEQPERRSSELTEIRRRHPDARVISLLSWPRQAEAAWLAERNVVVLAQPFRLTDLLSFFRECRPLGVSSAA